ncbi:MAG: isoprenylcysteine carboxyl methyltransferase [Spartobacteria bacterium]|nr:isoprenylcysteine carboxyl methyltransferase [Spartobacteria bacterium]
MKIQAPNLIYLVGLVIYVFIRGVFGGRTKRNQKIVHRVDAIDRVLVALVFVGTLLLPAIYLVTPWLGFADYQVPEFINWCGAVVMIIALWLFWRAHVDLGLNWSITLEMRKHHELITRGVYRRIRHPMYTAIFLFAIAQAFLLRNWLAGWAGFVTFAALYLVRTPREEKMMNEFFGEKYRDYMQRTGRLWPGYRATKNGDQLKP